MLFMSCVCLFFAALWSPAGKGLASWLLFVMFFVTFSCGIVLDCIDFAAILTLLSVIISLFHTGPESHESTNIWIRG